jgi:hypothetical protein
VTAAGHLLGIPALQNFPGLTPANMRSALTKAGFQLLTDSKYLTGGDYLLPGDISSMTVITSNERDAGRES